MRYTETVLDRKTGEETTRDIGDWITVTELGQRYGVGCKTVRATLHHMGVLQREGTRYRLPRAFVEKGYGKRFDRPARGFPFDVLSPLCQAMIAEAWEETVADYEAERQEGAGVASAAAALAAFEATRSRPLDTQQQVCWFLDHFPDIALSVIAQAIEADLGLVSRYAKVRRQQLEEARRRKAMFSGDTERMRRDNDAEMPA